MYSQVALQMLYPKEQTSQKRKSMSARDHSGLVQYQISRFVAGRLTPALHASRASYVFPVRGGQPLLGIVPRIVEPVIRTAR